MSRGPVRGALRAVAQAVLTMFGAAVVVWALLPLAPGDPARRVLLAQGDEEPTAEQIADARGALGLDEPLVVRFAGWLGAALRGDLGMSWATGEPVTAQLAERFGATALLAGVAVALAVAIAVPLSVAAAAWAGRWPDIVARVLALLGAALPGFVLALLVLQFVVLEFGLGRVLARGSPADVWLPALVLAFGLAATWARLLRAALLDAVGAPFAWSARARGAGRGRLLWRHALPHAAVPFLHALAISLGALLGGAAIIESVFSWPGVGRHVVEAVARRDLPVVQGFAVLATGVYVLTSLLVDLVSRLVDPRLRTS